MEKDLKKEGYSKEEEYFHKLNQALIKKIKKERKEGDAEKNKADLDKMP